VGRPIPITLKLLRSMQKRRSDWLSSGLKGVLIRDQGSLITAEVIMEVTLEASMVISCFCVCFVSVVMRFFEQEAITVVTRLLNHGPSQGPLLLRPPLLLVVLTTGIFLSRVKCVVIIVGREAISLESALEAPCRLSRSNCYFCTLLLL